MLIWGSDGEGFLLLRAEVGSSSLKERGLKAVSWRRPWQPTPVLLPGKSHGQKSLVGCSLWGWEESDTTERLHFPFSLSCTGEGNGNPLRCSCLENPRDDGAWWAAVCGVAQSRTRLKRLRSSSSKGGQWDSTSPAPPQPAFASPLCSPLSGCHPLSPLPGKTLTWVTSNHLFSSRTGHLGHHHQLSLHPTVKFNRGHVGMRACGFPLPHPGPSAPAP